MESRRPVDAPPIRIEAENEWAWCGERRLDLQPRVFSLLRHLVERPNRLITKNEILAALWGDTAVSDAALTSCVRDLRKALGDPSHTPRYIETVHRRGFRFIGPVAAARSTPVAHDASSTAIAPRDAPFVGRDGELGRLHALFAAASGGDRRLVFVAGEAGVGKTALVEAFLAQLGDVDALRVGRGQCVEQYGTSEPYLPVFEALGRMGREQRGELLVRILRQYAPTWLAQLPALLGDDELEAVHRRAQGATRERMLREISEAFDALSMDAPLVLLLEDLHWSDAATVDLLAMLGRRSDPARLLIIGTYRPAEVGAGTHPLKRMKQELQLHEQCDEVSLDFLSEAAVSEYLHRRFSGASFSRDLARVLHAKTSGNPLFLVNVVYDVVARGHVRRVDGEWALSVPVERVASGVPQTLSQMIEQQIERLAPQEQAVLAVASVAGVEFSAALTTVEGISARDGEQCCDALARRGQFLRTLGVAEWSDGTVAGRYGFIHALYRDVLYAHVSIGHRVGLHLRIGARLERAHGVDAGMIGGELAMHFGHLRTSARLAADDRAFGVGIAGELAMHFEHGRDFERAVLYHGRAADTALRQNACREALAHATRALDLVTALPQSPERSRQELVIQTVIGAAVIATNGWTDPDVARAYARASELCAEIELTPEIFPILVGLAGFYLTRGELVTAEESSRRLSAIARATEDATTRLGAHNTAGMIAFYRGQFLAALRHFERSSAIYDRDQHSPNRHGFAIDHDQGVSCGAHTALTLMMLGYQDRAAASMRECLEYARSIDHPLSVAFAYNYASTFHQFRRERRLVQEIEDVRLAYAREHDFELFLMLGGIYRGWLLVEDGRAEEGAAQIEHGLAIYKAVGAELGTPTFLGILADVYDRLGRPDQASSVIDEASSLSERTGSRYWDAELRRLKGTFVLHSARSSPAARRSADRDAESLFVEAIEIARGQEAKSLELRAAMCLSRLWARQGSGGKAHALLSDVYGWFSEGFETPDLMEAKTLLEQLERGTKTGGRAASDTRTRREHRRPVRPPP